MNTEILEKCNICDATNIEVVDPECNITRCCSCGYVFDNPRPVLDELISFYSRPTQYDSWLSQIGPRQELWQRRLRALSSTKNNGSLVDVGTGIGQFLAVARDSYTELYGTEVSRTAIQIAKEKYNLSLFEGTLEDFNVAGRTFANITLFHVLEHVPDPRLLLLRCHSLLSPNGILVIAVPNEIHSLRGFVRKMLVNVGMKKQRRGVGRFGLPRTSLAEDSVEVHLSHFTTGALRRLVRSSGFSIVKETLDPYYVADGFEKLKASAYYYACLAFQRMAGINIYDTMLFIARKGNGPDAQISLTLR